VITIVTRSFNIVSFTVYHPCLKVDCSAWVTLRCQGHWRRRAADDIFIHSNMV